MNSIYSRSNTYFILAALFFLSLLYLLVAGSTVRQTTIQYDEFTDLVIATSLGDHPLSGNSYDGSQARFPMYASAAVSRLVRLVNPGIELLDLLPFSRWISILMSVLGIWGTYLLGSRFFSKATGLLAAALFTISPYVLHFGSDALTQGDAFTPAPVVFSLLAFDRFSQKRTTFWLVAFALCLALAIGAKFLLVVLLPGFMTYQLVSAYRERFRNTEAKDDSPRVRILHFDNRLFVSLTILTGIFALAALLVSLSRTGQPMATSNTLTQLARFLWGLTLLGILTALVLSLRRVRVVAGRWPLTVAWLAILPLVFAMVLAFFPSHIFNRFVITSLVERFFTMDGNSDFLSTSLDSIKLYLGLLLFKAGLPFGILTFVAFGWALRNLTRKPGLLLIIANLFFFFLMLAVLPLHQPFWLMSIYPLIFTILSALITDIYVKLADIRLRVAWVTVVIFSLGWLVTGVIRVYPTFGYYGYEMVSDRWLGTDSRGYRALVTVTNDGSSEAVSWLRGNIPADATVLSYLDDVHLVNYLEAAEPFAFNLESALEFGDDVELTRRIREADYAIIRVIPDSFSPYPLSDPGFLERFGGEPVFEVTRGRGIYRMSLYQVYHADERDDR